MDYVSEEGLRNLKLYKYGAVDKSIFAKYVLQPWWNFCASLFPLWAAPNAITLTGFSFNLINLVLLFYYIPDLETEAPRWVYFR